MTKTCKFSQIFLSSLLFALPALVKADVVENLVFTGTATCRPGYDVCSTAGDGPLTGFYSVDVTTQIIVGAWSFTTPFGVISSSEPGAYAGLGISRDYNPGFGTSYNGTEEFVQFYFPRTDPDELGPVDPAAYSNACQPNGYNTCEYDYSVTGANSLAVAAAPEPSSLLLSSLAILGLVLSCVARRCMRAQHSV